MSTYKRQGANVYSYDFRLKGRRFSGDTGRTSKREADVVERQRRDEARMAIAEGLAMDKPRTWEFASSRYWLEVGQYHRNAEATLKSLDWLTQQIGRKRELRDIDDNVVAGLVAKRRAEKRQLGRPKDREKQRYVSPATVNRTVTEPLRKVMLRAKNLWRVSVGNVTWRTHLLKEPQERIREISVLEEQKVMAALERGYEEAVSFAFRDGCRDAEICGLTWDRVDFFGRRYTVIGKGDRARTIPMSQATFDQLWRLRGRHPVNVFTFVARRTRKDWGQVRGHNYPIKPARLSHVAKAAALAGGVPNFHLHDTRHTAATRTLRVSNLRVVQNLLGHEDVTTTTKYAHALEEDVRRALNSAKPTRMLRAG